MIADRVESMTYHTYTIKALDVSTGIRRQVGNASVKEWYSFISVREAVKDIRARQTNPDVKYDVFVDGTKMSDV